MTFYFVICYVIEFSELMPEFVILACISMLCQIIFNESFIFKKLYISNDSLELEQAEGSRV